MPAHDKPVAIHHARSITEAQVVRAVLENAGIPSSPEYTGSWDEFSQAQQSMNLKGVKILVPADRADAARRALKAARAAGGLMEEERE